MKDNVTSETEQAAEERHISGATLFMIDTLWLKTIVLKLPAAMFLATLMMSEDEPAPH